MKQLFCGTLAGTLLFLLASQSSATEAPEVCSSMISSEISFASDNHTGVHPRVMEALARANTGSVHAYGDDPYTARARETFQHVFGSSAEPFFVFNGTAANVLSLAAMLKRHEAVLCTSCAHLANDECGAPEAWTGCQLIRLPHTDGKLTEEGLAIAEAQIQEKSSNKPHQVQPRVLSLTQSTELGTVYSIDEIRRITEWAHSRGLLVHMDGARIANAAAALGTGLGELTSGAGVDVLSFGGTKNGLLGADAVVFFDSDLARDFAFLRKQSLQLASKMRFLSVQLDALLVDGLWRENALHANKMAAHLARVVGEFPELKITRPVQANAVFVTVPAKVREDLLKKFFFYTWDESTGEVRLMTAFNTKEEDIILFKAELERILGRVSPGT